MKHISKKIFAFFAIFFALFFIGNTDVYAAPVHWSVSGSRITIKNYTKVYFEDTSKVSHQITSYDDRFDLSVSGSSDKVYAYIIDDILYIQFNGTLYFNPNSSHMFTGSTNLTEINGLQYVNTSEVTNMSNMFSSTTSLTSLNLSNFNTANVTDMSEMFEGMYSLTSLNISSFNTSNVTNMYRMFYDTNKLTTLNLGSFNTSNVTNMSEMFARMSKISSLSLASFNTNNVTNMNGMFKEMTSLTSLSISSFRTPNVTDMGSMFEGTNKLTSLNLNLFNTANVTNMAYMFKDMSALTSLYTNNFDTSNVTNMSGMFENDSNLTTFNISSFRTPNVVYMQNMFYNLQKITQLDVTNFNTSNVTNMSGMFYNMIRLSSLDVSGFNTANVTDMSYMFTGLPVSSIDVSSFNTANVEDMSYMFASMGNITVLELGSFSTASIEYIDYMFYQDVSLERIWVTYNWNIPYSASGIHVFDGDTKLAVDYGTKYNQYRVDKQQARIDTYQNSGYLNFHWSLTSVDDMYLIDFPNWEISALQNVFQASNLIPSSNITTSYDNTYYYIIYNGNIIRRFLVDRPILVLNLDHANETITLIRGRYYQLNASVLPNNTTYPKTITWTSNHSNIASVDSTGKVKGESGGFADITASSYNKRNDSHSKSTTFEVIVPLESFTAESYIEIIPDEERTINTTILPGDTTEDKTVTWTSNNTNVVTVDSTGKLTGVLPGRTTVYGVIANGRYLDQSDDQLKTGLNQTVDVKVLIPIREFELAEPTYTLYVGDPNNYTKRLTPIYRPDNYEVDGTLDWTTTDDDVAEVDANGVVTGKDEGTVTIEATVRHYPQFHDTTTVDVKVLALGFDVEEPNTVKNIEEGEEFTFTPNITPNNSSYKEEDITWSSSDQSVATVDQNGKVKGINPGNATITATLANGYGPGTGLGHDITITRTVHVKRPIRTFGIVESRANLYVNNSSTDHIALTTSYSPSDYEVDGSITWTSSNDNIAEVVNGVVTGKAEGTARITATLNHYPQSFDQRTLSDYVDVDVKVLATNLTIDNQEAGTTKYIEEGEEFTYTKTVTPPGSSYKTVTWTSSDPTIATVDSDGKVTGVSSGTVTITAFLANGLGPAAQGQENDPGHDITLTRTVHVKRAIQAFELTDIPYNLYVNNTSTDHVSIVPLYTPSNYEVDDSITWTSSNTNIAEVANGVVTGKAEGQVTITATLNHYPQSFDQRTLSDSVTVNVKVLATNLTIDNQEAGTTKYIEEGEEFTYTKTVTPPGSSYKTVTWTSSDPTIATVDSDGKVTGVSSGTVTITAFLANGLGPAAQGQENDPGHDITLTRTVHVKKAIQSFELTDLPYHLYVGDTSADHVSIVPLITPNGYEVDDSITWTSSNTNIAEVANGVVTGKAEGQVTITATLNHYPQSFDQRTLSDSVTVNVSVLATNFTINNQAANTIKDIEVGEDFTYTKTISPEGSSYTNVTWTSSNSTIATVDGQGKVTGVAPGNAIITAVLSNGYGPGSGLGHDITLTREVHVKIPINSFSLREETVNLYVEDSSADNTTLHPVYNPTPYEVDGSITWESSDDDIAEVDEYGVVTGKAEGQVTITATLNHYPQSFDQRTLSDSVIVNVTVLATNFTINNQAANTIKDIEVGEEFTYTKTISPEGSSYTNVTWTSSNSTIATVDGNGKVKGISTGNAIITAVLSNGYGPGSGLGHDITLTREVHVKRAISSFELTKTNYDLYVGNNSTDHKTIVPIILPNGYEVDDSITWTSSNDNIAEVVNGVVTGKAEGTARITATLVHYPQTFDQRTLSDYVDVTVKVLADGLTINNQAANTTLGIEEGEEFTYQPVVSPQDSSYTTDDITWSSSNSTIATVDQNGKVTGVSPGNATITATLANGLGPAGPGQENDVGYNITITRDVHVKVPIRGITITEQSATLYVEDSNNDHATLHPVLTPNGYEVDDTIGWTSSNNSVVTVSGGVITAHAKGTATITATVTHYGNRFTASVPVEVKLLATGLNITNYGANDEMRLEVGEEESFQTSITPEGSSYQSISWSSDNSNIATVDEHGKVTAVNPGDAVITATLTNGYGPGNGVGHDITITRDVHVLRGIEFFDVTEYEYELYAGNALYDNATIVPVFTPDDFEVDGTIDWESSDDEIADVDEYGVITGHAPGTAVITGTVRNYPEHTIDIDVTVKMLASSIQILQPSTDALKTLEVGQEFTYTAKALPNNASYKTIRWTSSNSTIAQINRSSGKVKALSPGTVTITATLSNGPAGNITVTRQLKVLKPIRSFDITESSVDLYVGDNQYNNVTLTPTYEPADHEVSGALTWSSSDSTVAEVDSSGHVIGKKEGTAVITATVNHYPQTYDQRTLSDSTTVNVTVLASGLTITNQSEEEKHMEKNDTYQYTTSISPEDSSYTSISWSSSDANIVSVDQNGNIRAENPGRATITATLANGLGRTITASKKVKVLKPITNFDIQESSETLYIVDSANDNIDLTPVYSPSDFEVSGTIDWVSSNPNVATVDSTGHVEAVAKGTATITGTLHDYPIFTDSVTIDVKLLATGLSITNQSENLKRMEKNDEYQYTTSISPGDSSYTSITWSSSNTSIVSVTQTGKITALEPGTVTITATLTNGYGPGEGLGHDISVSKQVKVLKPITSFDINESTVDLYVGDNQYVSKRLTTHYSPSDFEVSGTIDWSSSDPTIAEVIDGVVTGNKEGTVTITGTLHDYPIFTDSVTVNVTVLASSLTITNQSESLKLMEKNDEYQYTTSISPEDSSYTSITWSSDDTSVVEVSSTGKITAKEPGVATITATLANGLGRTLTDSKQVKVLRPINSFDISESVVNLYIGDDNNYQKNLTPVYSPTNYEVSGVIDWSTSDSQTVSVDAYGHIIGLKEGTATITGTLHDYPTFTDSVTVNVTVLANSFDITNQASGTTKQMEVGDEFEYQTLITPVETSSYRSIAWSSSNTSIVAIDQTGKITAQSAGTVTITAVLTNGYGPGEGLGHNITVTRQVKVLIPITGFNVQEDVVNMYIGDNSSATQTLTPVYVPADCEVDKTLEWTSGNTNVVTVNNGVLTAVGNGDTTVTARVVHYGQQFKKTIDVHVKTLATAFDITNQTSGTTKQMEVGDEYQYATSITPDETSSYRSVAWSSSNTSIVAIDQTGKITAQSAGTVTITAVLTNGYGPGEGLGHNITVTRQVKVLIPITGFNVQEDVVNMYIGDSTSSTQTLTPVYVPADCEVDKTLEWTSGNTNVVTVNNGVLTAVGNGDTTVTARVVHYGQQFKKTIDVHVKTLATAFDITNQTSGTTKQMEEGQVFDYQTSITPSETSSYRSIAWSSSNSTIVDVDQNGRITAQSPGTATITAVLTNGYGPGEGLGHNITVTRQVKVLIPVRGFTITETDNNLYIGVAQYETKTLTPVFNPSDCEVDKTLEWTSGNTNVVTVNNGVLTAVGNGDTTVTARVVHYGQQFKQTVNVHVRTLTLSFDITNQTAGTTKNMEVTDEYQYATNISPGTSSYKEIAWSSSVPTVATVDQNGKVKAFAAGDTVITATLPNGLGPAGPGQENDPGHNITVTRAIHVLKGIENFDLQEASIDLFVSDPSNDHATITPIYNPEIFEVPGDIVWTSSDDDIAIVENGVVTGKAEGTAIITGRVEHYGNKFIDSVEVNVKVLTTNFEITNQAANEILDVDLDTTFKYQTRIDPSASSYTHIVWSSNNERVATISSDGTITPLETGSATITAYLANGYGPGEGLGHDITLTRTIRVPIGIDDYTIQESVVNVYAGNSLYDHVQLHPVYTPANYQVSGAINWVSGDTDVATVDSNGVVTAGNKTGSTTITAQLAHYGDLRPTRTVTVNTKILTQEYTIDNQEAGTTKNMEVGDTFDYATTIDPSNSDYKTFTWSSSDDQTVSVDQTGHIVALKPGNATITTTLDNGPAGNIEVSRNIKVLVPIDDFTIQESTVNVYAGNSSYDHVQLHPVYDPTSGYEVDDTINWVSGDTDVATVDSNGVVTAGNKTGSTTITAQLDHYGNKRPTRTVTVNTKILTQEYTIDNQTAGTTKRMEIGDTFDYATTIDPTNSDYKTVTWSSSDDQTVSVDQTGHIVAIKPGTVTITTTLDNGPAGNIEVSREVKVLIPITGFNIVESSIDLYIGDSANNHKTLSKTYDPTNYEVSGTVTWESDHENIATVNSDGTVTAVGNGTATITGSLYNGLSDTVTVNVHTLTTSFDITNQTANETKQMEVGDELIYATSIVPNETSSYKSVTWTSSDESVATVVNGTVTALHSGNTTITAVLTNGYGPGEGLGHNITLTRQIHVKVPIENIAIREQNVVLYIQNATLDHTTLHIDYTPSSGYEVDDSISWSSSNDNVVTVDDGVITAHGKGTATITASADHYEGMTSTSTIEVKVLTATFDIQNQTAGTTKNMEVGDDFDYQTNILPENSSYKSVVWESSDDLTVSIDQTGHIEALKPGTVTITATLANGPLEDKVVTRQVKVLIPMTGFNITDSTINLYIGDNTLNNHVINKEYIPSNCEVDKTLDWTNSDSTVVSLNTETGQLTGLKEGTATIEATVHSYPEYHDSVNVVVKVLTTDFDITDQEEGTTKNMEVGQTHTYTTSIQPSESNYKTVTWSSSSGNVASIDPSTGLITALTPGTTTITATINNGPKGNIEVSRNIKVLVPITGIDIQETSETLYINNSTLDHTTLHATLTPSSGYEVSDDITWESSDTDVATVDANGVVTGVGKGTATITARVTHYGNSIKDTMTVNVYVLTSDFDITDQEEGTTKNMEVGQTHTYTTQIQPETPDYSSITWSSSDGLVASINPSTGLITALAPGTTTITATLNNGPGGTIEVSRDIKVLVPITGIDIQETSETLYVNNSTLDHTTLHATLTPSSGYEVSDDITWSSSDTDVATVDANGVVTGVGKGEATITARVTHYGNSIKDTMTVNVYVLTADFDITDQEAGTTKNMEVGQTHTYTTQIQPETPDYSSITWSSSNGNAASINPSTGLITALAPGTTTITATLNNGPGGTIEVSRNIKVLTPITGIDIQETSENLYINSSTLDHTTLHTTLTPSSGYEVPDGITWVSSDEDVATVDANGVVTAVGKGEATITAKVTHYGNAVKDTMTVNVYVLTADFDITNQDENVTKRMNVNSQFTYETSIDPSTSDYKSVSWDSSDDLTVSVDNDGHIVALKPGTVTITATLNNGPAGNIEVTREVKVLKPITGFNINETSINLTENVQAEKTHNLQISIEPSEYEEDDDITWTYSDDDIVEVDANGVVTAIGPGHVTVTGTLPNGLSDSFTVDVAVVIEQFILETPSDINVELGGTYEARTSYSPLNTTESKTVSWSSDDDTIATVDPDGTIHGVRIGNTIIRGTLGNKEVTVNVDVIIGITSFTISDESISLVRNETHQLSTTIDPSNTTESKTVTWRSSDDEVAIVDQSTGLVTAKKTGTATITGTLPNGMHVECAVTVLTSIESFTVSPKTATINMNNDNKTVTLTTEILPSTAQEDKTVTWDSSDDTIASVVDGVVTGVGNGTATITATLPNGMSDTAEITVVTPITNFNVTNGKYHELTINQTHEIETEIIPSSTHESKVIAWSSSKSNVATVESDGTVTAKDYGTTVITGTLANEMTVSVTIKVIKPINNITLNKNTLSLYIGDSERNHDTLVATIDPDDTDQDKNITWATTNSAVASVDQNGNVTAVNKGTATISATLSNNMTAECVVTVYKPITSFTINGDTEFTLAKGKNKTLSTTIEPSDTTDSKTITWTSNNTSAATVTAAGKVTGKGPGDATITGRLSNGMEVSVLVHVNVPITSFTIGPSSIDLLPDQVKELTPTISPPNTTEDTTITWATSNSSIVSVVNGVLTAHNLGTATITASLPGGKTATMQVTVTLTPRTRMRGDFDDNGKVNMKDVNIALKKANGIEPIVESDYEVGDIDNNGRINMKDVNEILKYANGLKDTL